MVTDRSFSDFDMTKRADYYDELGNEIADESNRHKLKKPIALKKIVDQGNNFPDTAI